MASSNCCVCLHTSPTLQDIVSRIGDSPSWMDKLRDVSPEMNWLEDSAICNSCTMRVEEAFTFQSSLLHVRDSSVSKEIKSEIIEVEYNCIHCQKSFSDIDELDHHEKFNHVIIKEEPALVMPEEEELISEKKPRFSTEVLKFIIGDRKRVQHSRIEDFAVLKEDKRPVLCSKCPESFYTTDSLYKHNSSYHRTPTYKCHLCEKAFLFPSKLQNHIQEHQNLRKFKCHHCDRAYNTNRALQKHLKTQGVLPKQNKQFSCDVCNDKFPTGAEVIVHCVKKHLMDVSDVKPYKCDICSVTCCTSNKLSYHKRKAHKK